jgi:hypothetical protein
MQSHSAIVATRVANQQDRTSYKTATQTAIQLTVFLGYLTAHLVMRLHGVGELDDGEMMYWKRLGNKRS